MHLDLVLLVPILTGGWLDRARHEPLGDWLCPGRESCLADGGEER